TRVRARARTRGDGRADDVDRDPAAAGDSRFAAGARRAGTRDGDRSAAGAPRERWSGEGDQHPAESHDGGAAPPPPPAPEDHARRESFAVTCCSPEMPIWRGGRVV